MTSVCCRASGNLIASTQHRPHQHNVVFFECNGLKHGEFTLEEGGGDRDTKQVYVRELQWSCDSSVLALWLESVVEEEEKEENSSSKHPESYGTVCKGVCILRQSCPLPPVQSSCGIWATITGTSSRSSASLLLP